MILNWIDSEDQIPHFWEETDQQLTGAVLSLVRAMLEMVSAWQYTCIFLKKIFKIVVWPYPLNSFNP